MPEASRERVLGFGSEPISKIRDEDRDPVFEGVRIDKIPTDSDNYAHLVIGGCPIVTALSDIDASGYLFVIILSSIVLGKKKKKERKKTLIITRREETPENIVPCRTARGGPGILKVHSHRKRLGT